jgi:hypothetical protein
MRHEAIYSNAVPVPIRNPFSITRRDFGTALLLILSRALSAAAQTMRSAARELPPVSWTCLHHPEVVDNKAGKCPICAMTLIPVRLDLVWTCTVHTAVAQEKAGKCPSCRRDLIRVIKAMSWTCPVHATVEELNPGRCRICRRTLKVKYADRPHGDHNPKHGGQFFMAPNNWHVEVTHPSRGVFRVYCYDEYSKPFMPKGFTARLEVPGESGRAPAQATFKLPGRRSPYLEARVPTLGLPAIVVVRVRFQADEPEYRFDFQFYDYSKERTG